MHDLIASSTSRRSAYAADMDAPRLSLVIPAWNEALLLPRLLDSLDVARRRWVTSGHAAAAIEVIVADNGSTDATAQIAGDRGCRVVPVARRVIAASRNGGAAAATGATLCFVDADSVLHPDCLLAIAAAMDQPRTLGGATRVTMDRWSPGIVATFALLMPMVWITGFDTGIVFMRRADFESIGGYDENLPLAEDVDLLVRLRRLGRTRGQSLVRLRGVKTITSTRKFDRHGDWHWFTQLPPQALRALRDRDAMHALAKRYWYEGR
ncbi:MAG TPA: glycosyltransferase [Xanthomonadaceae bacterium]|jgi:glycosyltransferase involved in cell wall biosynthesis